MPKRAVFYVYVNVEQSGQAGVENGAMLTTYLFMRRVSWNLAVATQQCRNYLYDKSRTNRSYDPLGTETFTKRLETFTMHHFVVPAVASSHAACSVHRWIDADWWTDRQPWKYCRLLFDKEGSSWPHWASAAVKLSWQHTVTTNAKSFGDF